MNDSRIPDGCTGTIEETRPGSEVSYCIQHFDTTCPVHDSASIGHLDIIRVIDFGED